MLPNANIYARKYRAKTANSISLPIVPMFIQPIPKVPSSTSILPSFTKDGRQEAIGQCSLVHAQKHISVHRTLPIFHQYTHPRIKTIKVQRCSTSPRHSEILKSKAQMKLHSNENIGGARVVLAESGKNLVDITSGSGQDSSNREDFFSESIHMDGMGLRQFPNLFGPNEKLIKLLSLQNNFITQLSPLHGLIHLSHLIVLDLYNNKIERLIGVHALQHLRVLLLGKNRIRRLEGLDRLDRLEILDLHGNQLRHLTNLKGLESLRILNVAGNMIASIRNLSCSGLPALTELNLKRNRLKTLNGLENAPNLRKLLVANNEIESLAAVNSLRSLKALEELLIDPNPICRHVMEYKFQLINILPWLRILNSSSTISLQDRASENVVNKSEPKLSKPTVPGIWESKSKNALLHATIQQTAHFETLQFSDANFPIFNELRNNSIGSEKCNQPQLSAYIVPRSRPSSQVAIVKPRLRMSSPNAFLERDVENEKSYPELGIQVYMEQKIPFHNTRTAENDIVEDLDANSVCDTLVSPKENLDESRPRLTCESELSSEKAKISSWNQFRSRSADTPGAIDPSDSESGTTSTGTTTTTTSDVSKRQRPVTHKVTKIQENKSGARWPRISSSSRARINSGIGTKGNALRNLKSFSGLPEETTLLKKEGSDYLVELDGKALSLFGQGALKHFLNVFPEMLAEVVNSIQFSFITFTTIVPYFGKLRQSYPALEKFGFRASDIHKLSELNALSELEGLNSIEIHPEGNPITENPLWKAYLTFRLGHWGLKEINGKDIEPEVKAEGMSIFGSLGHLALTSLPSSALNPLISRLHSRHNFCSCSCYPQNSINDDSGRKRSPDDPRNPICNSWDQNPLVLEVIGKESLIYTSSKPNGDNGDEILMRIGVKGYEILKKLETFEQLWPKILENRISDILSEDVELAKSVFTNTEFKNMNEYMLS